MFCTILFENNINDVATELNVCKFVFKLNVDKGALIKWCDFSSGILYKIGI